MFPARLDTLLPEVGLMRGFRMIVCLLLCLTLAGQAYAEEQADFIRWVDFDLSSEAMAAAMEIDQRTWEQEQHLSWIDLLALAATRKGSGRFGAQAVRAAAEELRQDKPPSEFLGSQYKYYQYWQGAYGAVLGGLLGSYAIEADGQWKPSYGLKGFSPIAAGYWYQHYDDFGQRRSYGFSRPHLGNDLMGGLGTPICAVEGGVVEALGWNQYGGWRVGIRSHDGLRYWYYAHLQKGHPYAAGLTEGSVVQAGDVIGYMGRTGYSLTEDTNNIEVVHLHFGLQLIFDESQKDGNNEIWVDVYQLVRLLDRHRCSVSVSGGEAQRIYAYRDLDTE